MARRRGVHLDLDIDIGVLVAIADNAAQCNIPSRSLSTSAPKSDTKNSRLMIASIRRNTFPLTSTARSKPSSPPSARFLIQAVSVLCRSLFRGVFGLLDSSDSTHVAAPLAGNVVELYPAVWAETGMVANGDTIVVLSVTKMVRVVVMPRGRRAVQRKRLLMWGSC